MERLVTKDNNQIIHLLKEQLPEVDMLFHLDTNKLLQAFKFMGPYGEVSTIEKIQYQNSVHSSLHLLALLTTTPEARHYHDPPNN